jgi:two-component system, OmpR family, phosphate regulon response regulator PhoB
MADARPQPTLALIVEDDPATRALETDVLEDGGFNVLQARNGEDALRLAQQRKPGVVLLDIALPTTSGFDVLRTLKSRPATSKIPVVLVSAYTALVDDCQRRGADACVHKPFDIDGLLAQVRGVLEPA